MTPKEKKAFVKRMREAKEAKRKGSKSTKSKGSKSTGSKFDEKAWRRKVEESRRELDKWSKEKFKGKSDADLRRIIRTKKGNTDDEGHELGRRIADRL
jgi:predicted outer membrane protein